MMAFAGKISAFINKHPSLQMLAMSFLILIGFMLALEAFHFDIPKGYDGPFLQVDVTEFFR